MAITRQRLLQIFSVVYLILVTALSGYATSRSLQLSLPIPRGLAYSTTTLPLFSALLLELGYVSTRRQQQQRQRKRQLLADSTHSPLVIIAHITVVIYSTAVITLLGTHATPSSELDCGLRERWVSLFRQKNEVIRTIQDRFQCCGFKNPKDMAWPFADKNHRADACELDFGRDQGCLDAWKGEERRLAGILMAVVGLVSLWQICSVLMRSPKKSWLHQILPERISRIISNDGDGGAEGPRKRIGFTTEYDRYSDETDGNNNAGDTDSSQRRLEGATYQAMVNPNVEAHDEDQERPVRPSV